MDHKKKLIIGTRGSALALAQSNWVADRLREIHPQCCITLQVIKTKGDILQDVSLAKIGGKGVFVKEIEDALLAGQIDLAVHSMKDVPAALPNGLAIVAVPPREDPRDVLVSRENVGFAKLRQGARIGTGSLRRSVQLQKLRPDIEVLPLRGNLDTRLRKLERDNLDGIILAAAGMRRLRWEERITEFLSVETMLPAVGQGALGIEAREGEGMPEYLAGLNDPFAWAEVTAERAFLMTLGGGCQLPIAGYATYREGKILLRGMVGSLDGKTIIAGEETGKACEAGKLGIKLAKRILDQGGRTLLEAAGVSRAGDEAV